MKRPISEIRRDAGVPQRLAAAELGIHRTTWGRWERNEKAPKRRTFSRAAMESAVMRAASSLGSGIQMHIADFVE
jgi:DNA-binding XRE family transcriptional regulator